MTSASAGIDDLTHTGDKTTTTVAMDFGRITLDQDLILYLFGTPRTGPLLVHVGRPGPRRHRRDRAGGHPPPGRLLPRGRLLRELGLPFVIALNGFDGNQPYNPDEVREALQIGPDTPIITTDARHRADAKSALITLVEHALMARLR
ncbi:ATP/GTP-binding protein [Streptomyces echinatus]